MFFWPSLPEALALIHWRLACNAARPALNHHQPHHNSMKNLSIKEARCGGTDNKYHPTICPQRQHCRRFQQLDLDRQLELPAEVVVTIKKMALPRVGTNECSYLLPG
ncbi:hypothetical protein [Piscinibacter gummiphilus]|uniref:Secreted protein n=1 Tax=Piscinibacter gummiphilus TaxID=946333 RepID=A0ABZ0CNG4_9BURK|nr:hypothetical protein [Piscinibacter gummiphilus]WOB06529.1 hypothetical protein RXV79_16525 [Piscinibacter gummiphilus]